MPQNIADLVERCSLTKHVSCETVAKHMRTHILLGRLEAGSFERLLQQCIDDLGILKRLVGCPAGDE